MEEKKKRETYNLRKRKCIDIEIHERKKIFIFRGRRGTKKKERLTDRESERLRTRETRKKW